MSAKKSWDLERKGEPSIKKLKVVSTPSKDESDVVVRKVRREPVPKISSKVYWYSAFFVFLFLVSLTFFGVWQENVRIQSIDTSGAEQERAHAIFLEETNGTYLYILPKNSIFFFPEESIRMRILHELPNIKEVSIVRTSFKTLTMNTVERTSAFLWCGDASHVPTDEDICYHMDTDGLVFKYAGTKVETEHTINETRLYANLDRASTTKEYPLRAHVIGLSYISEAIAFTHALQDLGVSIDVFSIREDEADMYLEDGTRITYVQGKEKQAQALMQAALPSINLSSHTIEYIDARFKGKVYIKRRGEEASTTEAASESN